MAFWEAGFGGSAGGNYRLRVQADVIAQEVGNNRSLVRYNAWIEKISGSGYFNNDPTYGNTNINGYNPGRSLGSYNFAAQSRYNLAVNEDYWIGHDNNGNANPYFGANFNLNNSPSLTSASTGGTFSLPTIPRYANITAWSLTSPTVKSVTAQVSTDRTSSLVDYSVNGGAWTRGYTGSFTNTSFSINNLFPATTYSIKIRVAAQDSGLYTESGLKSITTQAVTITSLTVPGATDTSLDIIATVSHLADRLEYRVQGDSTWQVASGEFTTKRVTLSELTANTAYTVEARARHKDTQQYTPVVTATGSTVFPQPLQPINLSPSGGQGVNSLTPTLDWDYKSTSPDVQSAYQIIVRRESDAVVVWDSGKIISSVTNAVIPETEV